MKTLQTIIVGSLIALAFVALAQGQRHVVTTAAPTDAGTFVAVPLSYNTAYSVVCDTPTCYKTSSATYSEPDCAKDYPIATITAASSAGGGGGSTVVPGRYEGLVVMGNHNRLALRQMDGGATVACKVYQSIR